MKKILFIGLLGFLLLRNIHATGQGISTPWFLKNKLGIQINEKDFDKRIITFITNMKKDDSIKTENLIDMVRLCNTIELNRIFNTKEIYLEYWHLFTPKYVYLSVKRLDAHLSAGMAFYSKKYNIWIGGVPIDESFANSMYCIIKTN